MRHVIWDWNGTLFDDLNIVVAAVNASLWQFGAGPITADDYRDHYTRPVHRFYERLLDREVTAAEWQSIDVAFHEAYRRRLGDARLTRDARAVIERLDRIEATQSVLSMWWHDELIPFVAAHGISDRMIRVDGNRGEAGETKAVHLARHIEALAGIIDGLSPTDCLVVGDSLDDARAAQEVGVSCVLYDGGSHHHSELVGAGVPVAATLSEAIELGGAGTIPT